MSTSADNLANAIRFLIRDFVAGAIKIEVKPTQSQNIATGFTIGVKR